MSDVMVEVYNVVKKFPIESYKPTFVGQIFSRKRAKHFEALKNISFQIKRGERLGVIGNNGSGKTTLLELLSGIMSPDSGSINLRGDLTSLIDLTAGFHPDLSGYENIKINGLLIGMSKSQIKERIDKIVKFADIGRFIHQPFYTYSSGMQLRLGFSVVIFSDVEILILDEGISSGDEKFKRKIYNKLKKMYEQNITMIVVSHEMKIIRDLCTRCIFLDKGRIVADGSPDSIVDLYLKK